MSAAAPGSPASDAGSESSVGSAASAAAASGASQATQQEIERADELKGQGNTFFKNKQYQEAIKAYTEALDLHSTAVLYGTWHILYCESILLLKSVTQPSLPLQETEPSPTSN